MFYCHFTTVTVSRLFFVAPHSLLTMCRLQDTKSTRKSTESWWGVGVDSDIAGSGLRAVLSAINSAIGDRPLPELKLSVGFSAKSGQADVASAIVHSLHLELPRRLQAAFFEVAQRAALETDGHISYEDVVILFKETYHYELPNTPGRVVLRKYKMENIGENGKGEKQLTGDFIWDSKPRQMVGKGTGSLSAILNVLNSEIHGTLSVREYAEHSIGEGSDVKAVSYVELAYDVDGSRSTAWGVASDQDITASGLKAAMAATNKLNVDLKPFVDGQ